MKLMDYLPPKYGDSPEMVVIQNALQPEVDAMWQARNEFLLQLDPTTATWGLALWEEAFGIPTDVEKDIDHRRSRVVAKLRGNGTTTVALIKSVSESFSNGEVEVNEIYSEYRLEILFVGRIGIPPNLEDLRDVLDEIVPAHLEWVFVINYRINNELAPYTHNQLAAYTHAAIREEDL